MVQIPDFAHFQSSPARTSGTNHTRRAAAVAGASVYRTLVSDSVLAKLFFCYVSSGGFRVYPTLLPQTEHCLTFSQFICLRLCAGMQCSSTFVSIHVHQHLPEMRASDDLPPREFAPAGACAFLYVDSRCEFFHIPYFFFWPLFDGQRYKKWGEIRGCMNLLYRTASFDCNGFSQNIVRIAVSDNPHDIFEIKC